MANRPGFPAYIDRNATNIDPAYDANQLTLAGFLPDQPISSKIVNTLFLIDALGITYLDYGTVRTRDYLELAPQRWSATKLAYTIGDSVITGGALPVTRATYYLSGYRIETDNFILAPAGAEPLLKPATLKPGRIWIYLDTSLIVDPQVPFASIRTEEAGPAVVDNPGAGEITIGGVEIDGAGEITGNIYAAVEPDYELIYDGPTFRWKTAAAFEGPMQFDGNVQIDGTLDVDGNATIGAGVANVHTLNGNNTLGTDGTNTQALKGNATIGTDGLSVHNINGDMTGAGRRTSGAITAPSIEASGASPVALTEGATVTANKSITGDVTTPLTMGEITALAKITAAAAGVEGPGTTAVPLPEGATIPTGKDLTLVDAAGITGTANSLVAVGQVNTLDLNGQVTTAKVTLVNVTTTTNSLGRLQWDGRNLACGDGTIAAGRRVAMPRDSYIAGPINTVNAIDDTGASITMFMLTGEVAIVKMESEIKNSSLVSPTSNFRIEANAVVIGGAEPRRAVADNVAVGCNRSVLYTAVADLNVVFKARYGSGGGTSTATNILLTVRHAQ